MSLQLANIWRLRNNFAGAGAYCHLAIFLTLINCISCNFEWAYLKWTKPAFCMDPLAKLFSPFGGGCKASSYLDMCNMALFWVIWMEGNRKCFEVNRGRMSTFASLFYERDLFIGRITWLFIYLFIYLLLFFFKERIWYCLEFRQRERSFHRKYKLVVFFFFQVTGKLT